MLAGYGTAKDLRAKYGAVVMHHTRRILSFIIHDAMLAARWAIRRSAPAIRTIFRDGIVPPRLRNGYVCACAHASFRESEILK